MNPTPATAAANKMRSQDLAAYDAMNGAKPQVVKAAQLIKDAGQLFHKDVLVLAHRMQVVLEKQTVWRECDQNIIHWLEQIQATCAKELRDDAEFDGRQQ